MKPKMKKVHKKAKKPQLCPRFRLSRDFFDKIWPSTSNLQGKDIMNMKSKIKKYVHKCQNLSCVHEFAYLGNSIFRFEHMRHLRMSRGTRWSSQIWQNSAKNVSRVQETWNAKKEAFWAHLKLAKQGESKESFKQGACESAKRKQEPPMSSQLHLVGLTHARSSFDFEPSCSLGS